MFARITIEINKNEKKNLSKNDYYGKENLRRLDDSRLSFGTCNFMRTLFIDFFCWKGWRADGVESCGGVMDGGVVWSFQV